MEKIIELIQSAGDGSFAIDRLQRIVFWNDACQEILGFEATEALGRPCYEVIGGTSSNGCAICRKDCAAIRARAKHEPIPTRRLSVRHKDGHEVWISVSTILVPSSWSELTAMVHLFHDISDYKRMESLVSNFSDDIADIGSTPNPAEDSEPSKIAMTDREREILQAMATGRSSHEIAEHLNISKATVRNHIHHILGKLGVRNRLEAVVMSVRAGLL